MTEHPESLQEALEDRDITLGLTPGRLLLVVIAVFVLVRVIRGLRR